MGNQLAIPPLGEKPSSLASTSQTSSLDRAISGATKRLEYLRGKQVAIGTVAKWLIAASGVSWFITHIDKVNAFFDSLISLQLKAIWGTGLAAAMYVLWRVLSSKTFQYTVTLWLDRIIYRLHHWVVARDKFGSAEFAIRRLQKRKEEAQEAHARVYAAFHAVDEALEKSQSEAKEALSRAQGFEAEIKRRDSGEGRPLSSQIGRISTDEVAHAFNLAKNQLRVNFQFFQEQDAQRLMLGRRCDLLKEVISATGEKLAEMELRLQKARERWELALQTMQAMQASDDIVESQEARTYAEALDGILKEAQFFDGRVQMLMDRLDPTVQQHRMVQAADSLEDERFYREALQGLDDVLKPETKERLLTAAPERSDFSKDVQDLLGSHSNTVTVEAVPVRTGGPKSSKFGDLFKPKK